MSSGLFSSASTWQVSSSTNAICSETPTSDTDAIIIIRGFNVTLDVNYAVAKDGSIRIENSGSLIGGADLILGDGTGSQAATQLIIEPGGTLRVAQLTVDKATIMVDNPLSATRPTTLTTDCNLVLINSFITDNSQTFINGSIDLTKGGSNNTLCGTGSVRIIGCVFGGNGAVRKMANNCASSLVTTVCSQQQKPAGCPGPVSNNNANEAACDVLVGTCAPLPVELILFTATTTARQTVVLHWVTASEKNSHSFVVERSADGKVFRSLGTLAAAGSTQARTTYDLTDEQPLSGISYYRLRQVDLDGTTTYSPVRNVKRGLASGEGLAVYPGRSAQEWVVSTALPAEILAQGPAVVRVIDALGRLHQVPCPADASQAGQWALDLRSLPTGIYIVRLITAAGSFSQRIAQ
ncbi:hypothetical protein GCM10022407_07410 [Hymenobacter antarcticus]|uniref:Por secretion system C-terminal sorting domain-containing protein n=2 Tax=Hymenobacter antarcticus TaxID=486270 RepID=A0ABP7PC18_9BACT